MKTYNGIVELTIGPLAGKTEVEIVKQKAAELPQTMLAFMGASGKSVKIWTCFTRPDGTLPQTTEEAEVFQAHAYRLAIKCYQPQLPFNILLKEPKLEQFSRLSYDPDVNRSLGELYCFGYSESDSNQLEKGHSQPIL